MKINKRHIVSILFFSIFFIIFVNGCGSKSAVSEVLDEHMIHFKRGQYHLSKNQYADAESEFKKAIDLYPYSAPYFNYLGLTYLVQKKYNEAILEFDKGLRITTDYGDLYNNRGLAYFELGKADIAIEDFKKALQNETYPTPENSYFNIGRVYFVQKNWLEAEFNFNKAYEIYKKKKSRRIPPEVLAYYGITLVKQSKYSSAIDPLKKAIDIDPRYSVAHYNLAIAYYNENRPEEALKHFLEVKNIISKSDPNYDDLMKYINSLKRYM